MAPRTTIGWRRLLRRLRKLRGWTQMDMATYLDVSYSLITKWETGARVPRGLAARVLCEEARNAEQEAREQ